MMPLRLALFSIVALLACATAASANTFYVSTAGSASDSNPGSQSQPWRTIQHAVDTINPGDTIIVQAGAYAGCRIGRSGNAGAPCTLMAQSPGSVLINSLSTANRHQSLIEIENFDATVRYWVIDGFELSGSQRYGVDLRDTDFVTVRNCIAHGSRLTGIFLAFCYHPLIQNNESYSNGEHGIYQSNSGDYPTIRGNNLHNNASAGLHMNGDRNFTPGDGIISFAVVEKNVVWENGLSGGSGINCDGVSDSIIRNNLLYNNHASGISLYAIDGAEGSSRNRVYNNTIIMAADGRWCINIPPSSEGQTNPVGNDVKNNILYTPHSFRGSVSTYSGAVSGFSCDYNVVVNRFSTDDGDTNMPLSSWRALGYDQHSIVATPDQLFSNAAGNDYSLKSGSPAIDAGTSLAGNVTDDIGGTSRPQGAGYDIGCYESTGAPAAPTADFSASPTSGVAALLVQFTDLSTGGATGWSWDFGDGGTSASRNPSHTYQSAGSFTVRLTASNTSGQNTRTRTNYIVVTAPAAPPVAEFTATPLAGTAPLAVQFTDQSTGSPTAWSWDFGDGSTSTSRNPSHTFQSAGSFTITLTASNSGGPSTRTRTNYVTVSAPTPPPVAEFVASPLAGTAPLAVQFTDQSTGSPTAWSWDFGDGSTSTSRNPSHTYQNAGSFTVRLTSSNSGGQNTRTRTSYIVVSAPVSPPIAEFGASPVAGTAPLAVQFADQSTGATAWSWNFGDGAVSTDRNPTHVYQTMGTYSVSLTVTNSAGQNTRTRAGYINVSAPTSAPQADFTANPTNGTAPLVVQFTDQSTGSPVAWSWDFGDGQVSSQRNPSHTYSVAGNFTVRLTASNSAGQATRTRPGFITVTSASSSDFFCASVMVEVGKWMSGDETSVRASDDSYLKTKAKRFGGRFSDQINYLFETGLASVSSLSITSESRSAVSPVRQQVFMFNPTTGEWEQIDDRSVMSDDDTTNTVSVPNPSRYLSSTGQVRVRILTGDVEGGKWKHWVDLVKISAIP